MFGNRKLKREIVVLNDENDALREKIKALHTGNEYLNTTLNNANSQLSDLLIKNTEKELKIEELKTKVRLQNEADLMFCAVNIIKELLEDKKLDEIPKNTQQDFMRMMKQVNLNNQTAGLSQGSAYGLGSLLGIFR